MAAAPQTYDKRAVLAWSLYDFANSSFTTMVVTFVYAAFFTKLMAEDEILGTALWSRGVTVTAVIVAVASPILGAVADRGGWRKALLGISTAVCVLGTAMLYFPRPYAGLAERGLPGEAVEALVWFVVANVAFEMGNVFYNAFLPDIAPADKIGRVSGYGWASGYVGGLLCMVVAFAGFVFPEQPWFGLSTDDGENVRATSFLVAAWYALFSIPLFVWVREDRSRAETERGRVVSASVRQLVETFREIKPYRQVGRLLLARLVYNDGLVTIFAFGGVYAAGTFGFAFEEIVVFGIVLNVTAGCGAFAMGFLDDRIGGRKTILITLGGLGLASLLALLAPDKTTFWVSGILVGIFSGPNQAASRSLLARFVPPDKENEFFGFFAFSGKATAFLGPLLFGLLTEAFATQRAGIVAVTLFFAVGAVLLVRVDEAEGISLAEAHDHDPASP
jgi:UMF1 family MFS transporter